MTARQQRQNPRGLNAADVELNAALFIPSHKTPLRSYTHLEGVGFNSHNITIVRSFSSQVKLNR